MIRITLQKPHKQSFFFSTNITEGSNFVNLSFVSIDFIFIHMYLSCIDNIAYTCIVLTQSKQVTIIFSLARNVFMSFHGG